MRRISVMPTLALLLGLAAVPLAAAEEAPVPLDLDALRSQIFGQPAPREAASCTVTNNCGPYSPSVSCTSASGNCTSGYDWVECDGVRTNCQPCHVSTRCSTGQTFSCTGTTIDNCEVEPKCFVFCNGLFYGSCPICP